MDRNAFHPDRTRRAIMRDSIGERWGPGLSHDITQDLVSVNPGDGLEIEGETVRVKVGPGLGIDNQGRLILDLDFAESDWITIAVPVIDTYFESEEMRVRFTEVQIRLTPSITTIGKRATLELALETQYITPSTYPLSVDESEYVVIATTALCSGALANPSLEIGTQWVSRIVTDGDGDVVATVDGNLNLDNYTLVLTKYYLLENDIIVDINGEPLVDDLGRVVTDDHPEYTATQFAAIDAIMVDEDGLVVADSFGNLLTGVE